MSQNQDKLKEFEVYHRGIVKLEKAETFINKDIDKAFELAINVLINANENENPELVAKANFIIGKCHLVKEEFDEALICFIKAENIQRQVNDTIGLNNTLLLKGKTYYSKNDLESALGEFMKTMHKVNKNDKNMVFIDLNELIGKTYFGQDWNDSGVYYYKRIIPELKDQNNHERLCKVYHHLGYYYYKKYDYESALNYYYKGLESSKIVGNINYLSALYNKIGIINLKLELYEEALDSFKKVLAFEKELNDSTAIAIAYNNIGLVLKRQENYEQSELNFNQSLDIAHKTKNMLNIGMVNVNLGLVYQINGKYDEALEAFYNSYEIYKNEGEIEKLANTYNNLSATYLLINNLDSAKNYALKSYEFDEKLNDLEVKFELYGLLRDIYKKLGQTKESIKHDKLARQIKDKLTQVKNENYAEALSLKLYIKHKQKEYNDLIEQNIKQSERIDNQYIKIEKQRRYIIIFIFVLTLLSISVIYIVVLYLQKQKSNKLLTYRNRIIENQKKEIQQQKDNLTTINYELEKMSIIAERTNNAVAIMDKNGYFLWVNNGFTKMYGYTLNEFKEQIASNIFEGDDIHRLGDKFKLLREQKLSVSYEFLALCKDKTEIWAQTTLTPILDSKGDIYQYIAIDTDISEFKKAEAKIKQQHKEIQEQANQLISANKELEKLSIIAEKTNNSVTLIDSSGLIEWVNHSFTDIYGFSLSEIKGREYKQLVKEYFSLDIKKLVNVWFGTKVPVSYESLNNTKNNGKIWVNSSLTPILDESGALQKMVVIDSDITALKNAEQELKRINKDITSSISYAQRIQMASMPKLGKLEKYFSEYFVHFKPKDIVSGDFYWFTHHQNKTILVAADCTGHGVPGAFMSLIGISSLNRIVKEKNITSTSLILYQLRLSIIEALGQKGEIGETSDGMEVSIAVFDAENRTLEISGAMTQILLYKNETLQTIKGDRISIGYDQLDRDFSSQIFPLVKGDRLYLFSDGIIDQFGGPDNQKLKAKRFKEYLESISSQPLAKQDSLIDQFIENWQGDNPQLDDTLLIGVEY